MIIGNVNGTIYGTTSNENVDVKLVYAALHHGAISNLSTVYAELYYKRNNTGFTTFGTGTFTINIYDPVKGKTESKTVETVLEITGGDWVKAAEFNAVQVAHRDDGTGSATISASGSIPGTTLTSTTLSQTVSLGTIGRASSIDSLSCSTNYFTGTITYKYTPKSSVLYNRCNIALNIGGENTAVKTVNLGQKAASQQTATVTLSSSELETIYKKLPNVTSGKLRFTLRTYSDSGYSTQIGEAGYKEISLTIPNDTTTQPTMTMTLAPVSDFTSSSAIYVKGLSKVKATFSNGEGKYGATIASYKMTVAGKDYGSPYTSDYLATAGSIQVKGTIKDSRGYSRVYTQTITVIDYKKPSIDSLTCNTDYFNGTMTYKYTPANAVFYSRCLIALNINGTYTQIKEVLLGVKPASQQSAIVALTESELSTIYNKFPSSTSGTLRFTFRSYIDSGYSEQVGEADYKEITLSIPNIDATQPTATLTVAPENSLGSPFNTLYIKGKTKAKATLASGAGKYGATIKSYKVTIGTQSGASPLTSDNLLTIGDLKITGTVTDTRGYSRTYEKTITVLDHSTPRIIPVSGQSSVIAARCNAAGELDSNGTGLLIAAKRAYSKVVSGNSQKNYCAIQYRYKVDGGSYGTWTEILSRTATSDEVIKVALPEGTLSTTSTYMVQIRAIDDLGEAGSTAIFVSTEKVYMHRAGSLNSIAIGKYAEEENTVDIGDEMTTIFRGEVQFKSEAWISRALGTNVVASTVNSGRWGGSGVFYRVCAGGKHIYVAFNVSFTTSSSTVRAESETIPSAYRPPYDVYALCPVGFSDNSRGIATVSVSPSGRVNIYAVHKLPGATLSTGETVKWIDGYVDFWT
jgi:hypothetical protein